ncbi:MAG: hypothetical protein ACREJG_05520, partial [Candidatus Rokuibacteriota bacterium]
AQVIASVWAFSAMARTHGCRFPLGDVAKITGAAAVALVASWGVGQDSAEPLRLVVAAVVGFTAYLAACVALRAVGSAEYSLLLTSTRRLVAARPTGA